MRPHSLSYSSYKPLSGVLDASVPFCRNVSNASTKWKQHTEALQLIVAYRDRASKLSLRIDLSHRLGFRYYACIAFCEVFVQKRTDERQHNGTKNECQQSADSEAGD